MIFSNGWTQNKEVYIHNHFDSKRWNKVSLRAGDVIVSTYPKSGTTREQMTLLQLIHGGVENINITKLSPYIELCIEPIDVIIKRLESQKSRRVLKSHLPLGYLPYQSDITYIDIWRHPLDLAVSLYFHHENANRSMFAAINENKPEGTNDFLPNNLSIKEWVVQWVKKDGFPYWSYSKHIRSSWKYRNFSNVHLFHFSDLEKNGTGLEVLKRGAILGAEISEKDLACISSLCSFSSMKKNSQNTAPYGGVI